MADLSPTAEIAVPPPQGLSAGALLAQGFREVAARWPQALVLWALGVGARVAPRLFRSAEHVRHIAWTPADGARMVLIAAVAAVLAALALRLFLVRGPGWIRPDRGFWVCVGLLIAASLGDSAITLLGLRDVTDLRGAGVRAMELGLGLRLGLVFIPQAVVAWIYVRLMLWPIGALMGEAAMTPGRSWALMRGQVAGFVIAVIILSLPMVLATVGVTSIGLRVLHLRPMSYLPWMWGAGAVLSPATGLVQHAMAAVIWRAKTGAAAEAKPRGRA